MTKPVVMRVFGEHSKAIFVSTPEEKLRFISLNG
jgi:hypothetical protein